MRRFNYDGFSVVASCGAAAAQMCLHGRVTGAPGRVPGAPFGPVVPGAGAGAWPCWASTKGSACRPGASDGAGVDRGRFGPGVDRGAMRSGRR